MKVINSLRTENADNSDIKKAKALPWLANPARDF